MEKASSVQNYQEPSQMFDTDNFIFCSLNSETSKKNLQKKQSVLQSQLLSSLRFIFTYDFPSSLNITMR